ncbi:MAG: hypothetical protein ACREPI_08895 [Candidatus Dormibacterales bacterium]
MSIIDFIRDRARYYNCPVCGQSLKDCSVRMLSHVDDRFTVQVTCASCQVTFIVVLAIQGQGLEPVPGEELEGVEELEPADEVRAGVAPSTAPPIEADELLDLHLMLRDFKGPLDELLKEPGRSRG